MTGPICNRHQRDYEPDSCDDCQRIVGEAPKPESPNWPSSKCWCTYEAGDSPCPVHGMDEELSSPASMLSIDPGAVMAWAQSEFDAAMARLKADMDEAERRALEMTPDERSRAWADTLAAWAPTKENMDVFFGARKKT